MILMYYRLVNVILHLSVLDNVRGEFSVDHAEANSTFSYFGLPVIWSLGLCLRLSACTMRDICESGMAPSFVRVMVRLSHFALDTNLNYNRRCTELNFCTI